MPSPVGNGCGVQTKAAWHASGSPGSRTSALCGASQHGEPQPPGPCLGRLTATERSWLSQLWQARIGAECAWRKPPAHTSRSSIAVCGEQSKPANNQHLGSFTSSSGSSVREPPAHPTGGGAQVVPQAVAVPTTTTPHTALPSAALLAAPPVRSLRLPHTWLPASTMHAVACHERFSGGCVAARK